MAQLAVSVVGAGETGPTQVLVSGLKPGASVGTVKERLSQETGGLLRPERLRVLFAGRELSDSLVLDDVRLGPASVLHALVINTTTPSSPPNDKAISKESGDQSPASLNPTSYFVYCKGSCKALRPGKLRVRCSSCDSGAILLQREPGCWNDVQSRNLIGVECMECKEDAFADFYFKCVDCAANGSLDTSVPLSQVSLNNYAESCWTCGDVCEVVVSFGCPSPGGGPALAPHSVCLHCFSAYASVSLADRRFALQPGAGYTLSCPVSGCSGFVSDPHHFRLAGDDFYAAYQEKAAVAALLAAGGVFCPRASCGEAILPDLSSELGTLLLCPSCSRRFCAACRNPSDDCVCAEERRAEERAGQVEEVASPSQAFANRRTIRLLCKACPRCGVWTERNGGCHHMGCGECGFGWCWLCAGPWTEDCQLNHWFDALTI